ncbi:MAG: PHP domain-containing protein [Candidatus Eisenbacteria bacterium]|uniref:PHP domain-containing protein n=1 Tax=Eiseniibacteriota bacterium TaxID=2212470 RepID=A0A956RPM7_UNCEI|nr:PHP domain-containing protein [Candidatus Eisenbacteria bacterium]
MPPGIDLHLHTVFSDGQRTPAELVDLLAATGVRTAALTDHDTLEGIELFEEAARPQGIGVIPGVEVSVEHEGQDLHILAYWVDRRNPALAAMLQRVRDSRRLRLHAMVSRLHEIGIPVEEKEVLGRAAGAASVGRVHLAQELVEKGWVGHHGDVFRYYIGADGPAYRPKQTVGIEECLETIRAAGGLAVLAHPGVYQLEGVLDRLLAGGLDGLEVWHPSHTAEDMTRFAALAQEHGLLQTGGTDYHGDRDGEMMPGTMDLEPGMLESLERARRARFPAGGRTSSEDA